MARIDFRLRFHRLRRQAHAFAADRSGATAIEYALIASGVSVAIAATVTTLGSSVSALFTKVQTSLE